MTLSFASGDWVIHSVDPTSTIELDAFVHPDDRARFIEAGPSFGRPCEIVDETSDYSVVRIGSGAFRIKADALRKIPKPQKQCGEKVTVVIKGQPIECTVSKVVWHYARQEPYYFLARESGKTMKQWFFENDFVNS